MKIECEICKLNNDCPSRTKALWIEPKGQKGGIITGCNKGIPDEKSIEDKIRYLENLKGDKE